MPGPNNSSWCTQAFAYFCSSSCVFVSCLVFSWELSLVTRLVPGGKKRLQLELKPKLGASLLLVCTKWKSKPKFVYCQRCWMWLPFVKYSSTGCPVRQLSQLLPLPVTGTAAHCLRLIPLPLLFARKYENHNMLLVVVFSLWPGPQKFPAVNLINTPFDRIFMQKSCRHRPHNSQSSLEPRCIHCFGRIDP